MGNSRIVIVLVVASTAMSAVGAYAQQPSALKPHPFGKREHGVQQLKGEREPNLLPAEIQWISEPWYKEEGPASNSQMPYLVYMPEKDRLLMLVECQQPIKTAFITSDDHGKTWSERKWLATDAEGHPRGVALGLTNLGGGKLLAYPEDLTHGRWVSNDFGESWKELPAHDSVKERYMWDPLLVLKDKRGKTRLLEASWRPTGVAWASPEGFYSQGYLRSSEDGGQTWSVEEKVSQWLGVNEASLIRARNGDLVAACRTDYPRRFAHHGLDHFGGLAVSISKDGGKTWSALNPLYEWGRHHPSMVVTPDGSIVMTYVVRLGYPATHEGYPRFGVEAVVSRDHGQTWDKDHRYVLAAWEGNKTGPNAWFCSVQSTSTVQLPDGTLLTAFGTGFRNAPDAAVCKMDVALVSWRLSAEDKGKPSR